MEAWQAPDGSIIRAELPAGIEGSYYGPDLRALIHSLYANGMTQLVIFEFVRNVGIEISEGQIHNILMNEALKYKKESQTILAAGLQEASYIRVDAIQAPNISTKEATAPTLGVSISLTTKQQHPSRG